MDEYIDAYEVQIDPIALQSVKLAGYAIVKEKEDKFALHKAMLLVQIIPRELRFFVGLACLQTLIMVYSLHLVEDIYIVIGLHSALLGAYMVFELFRSFRYRMCELQYPTKLGMNRLFLYKALLILGIELILLSVLMLGAYYGYGGNGYALLAYGLLPNIIMCALLFTFASRLHSILLMLFIYGVGVALIFWGMHQLLYLGTSATVAPIITSLCVCSSCFIVGSVLKLQHQMKVAGGQLLWN